MANESAQAGGTNAERDNGFETMTYEQSSKELVDVDLGEESEETC